jgi:protein-tyrosine kinase
MEHIRIALEKAREKREEKPAQTRPELGRPLTNGAAHPIEVVAIPAPVLPKRTLDSVDLEERRIVTYLRHHPSHLAFDMLRTKIAQVMKEQNWTSIAVTSPTPGCGKTIVSLNLAFSMAQAANQRVALVDLDLRSPRVARTLGTEPTTDFVQYLRGGVDIYQIFAQVGDNLLLSLNNSPVTQSAEWMRHEKITGLAARIKEVFATDVIIFDVPPALPSDDTMVFSPSVDCAIIVAAAGETKPRELEDCEQQLSRTNCLGVVLNKVHAEAQSLYGYGYGPTE